MSRMAVLPPPGLPVPARDAGVTIASPKKSARIKTAIVAGKKQPEIAGALASAGPSSRTSPPAGCIRTCPGPTVSRRAQAAGGQHKAIGLRSDQ